jgi:hypothetical protein
MACEECVFGLRGVRLVGQGRSRVLSIVHIGNHRPVLTGENPPNWPWVQPGRQRPRASGLPVPAARRTPVTTGHRARLRRQGSCGGYRVVDPASNVEHNFHTSLSPGGSQKGPDGLD